MASMRRVAEAAESFREGAEVVKPDAEKYPEGPHAKLLLKLVRNLKSLTGEEE